jgi:hypothetical protein
MADTTDTKQLVIELVLENSELKSKLSEAEEAMSGVEKKSSGFIESIKKNWLALTAAVAGYVLAAKKVLSEAAAAEQAQQKLAQALRNTGEYSKELMDSFSDFADELQKTTNTENDTVINLLAMAKSMGLSNDEAKKAVQGAIGFNKTYGIDMTAALKASAAAMQGNTDRLVRYIPELANVKDDTEKLRLATEAMSDGYAIAQAQTEGMSGSVEQMKLRFKDVEEQIGGTLATALLPLVEILVSLLGWINKLPGPIKELVNGLVIAAATFATVAVAAKAMGIALSGPVLGAISLAVGALIGLVGAMKRAKDEAYELGGAITAKNANTAQSVVDGLKRQIDELSASIKRQQGGQIDSTLRLKNAQEELNAAIAASDYTKLSDDARILLNANQDSAKFLKVIEENGKYSSIALETNKASLAQLTEEYKKAKKALDDYNKAQTPKTPAEGGANPADDPAVKHKQMIDQLILNSHKATNAEILQDTIDTLYKELEVHNLKADRIKAIDKAIADYEKQLNDMKLQELQKSIQDTLSQVSSLVQEFTSVFSAFLANEIDAANRANEQSTAAANIELQNQYDEDLAALNAKYEQGIISAEDYNAQKLALDQKLADDQKALDLANRQEAARIKVKEFLFNQKAAIVESIISTAVAAAKALELGPILGPIMAVIISGLGLAKTIAIGAQKPPEIPTYSQGGIIDSVFPANISGEDGMVAVQRGESILTRAATAMLGPDAIQALNSGRRMGDVNITVNSNNPKDVVYVLNDYFRQYGTSQRGTSL